MRENLKQFHREGDSEERESWGGSKDCRRCALQGWYNREGVSDLCIKI